MLIEYLDGKQGHVHPDVGRALVAANLATAVPKMKFFTVPDTAWSVAEGPIEFGVEHPPTIRYKCKSCGICGEMKGDTCARTQFFDHCGTSERVPKNVADQFERLIKRYRDRGPKRKPGQKKIVSAFTPAELNRKYGIKTRQELIAEQMAVLQS